MSKLTKLLKNPGVHPKLWDYLDGLDATLMAVVLAYLMRRRVCTSRVLAVSQSKSPRWTRRQP